MTASSITPIPPMRADWTASGACTSGSTAPPRGATRRALGGAATTSTKRGEPGRGCCLRNRGTGDLTTHGLRANVSAGLLRRLGAALHRQRGGDDRLGCVHVGDGRDADARRLDDVDGMDADAWTDVAGRRGVVPRHVGRDDGGDDPAVLGPDAVALPPGHWQANAFALEDGRCHNPRHHRWDSPPKIRFAPDSPLEGDGFELSVPQQIRSRFRDNSPVSRDGLTVSRPG